MLPFAHSVRALKKRPLHVNKKHDKKKKDHDMWEHLKKKKKLHVKKYDIKKKDHYMETKLTLKKKTITCMKYRH